MHDEHLTPPRLRKLLEQGTGEEENRLLLHQLAICPDCYAVGGYILDLYRSEALSLSFCTIDIDLARSRFEAPALWETLRSFSLEKQQGLIRDTGRFKSWGLVELLCRESEKAAAHDPRGALEKAELAVAVAEQVPEWQPAERSWLLELRAFAWAHLGNARRVVGDLPGAEKAFAEAWREWEAGAADVGDVLGYEARILAMKASLRHAQRLLVDALHLLEEAHEADANGALLGIILINKARFLEESDRLEEAIVLLHEAALAVEPDADLRLTLCVKHNLLWLLTTAGRFDEAAALVAEVDLLSRSVGRELDLIRLRWAEARIAAGLGRFEEAVLLFEEVRRAFASAGAGYDVALASLELAALYADLSDLQKVKALAEELYPVFQAQDVHREALAALSLFMQAAFGETATGELARQIGSFLRTARYDPSRRFAP